MDIRDIVTIGVHNEFKALYTGKITYSIHCHLNAFFQW